MILSIKVQSYYTWEFGWDNCFLQAFKSALQLAHTPGNLWASFVWNLIGRQSHPVCFSSLVLQYSPPECWTDSSNSLLCFCLAYVFFPLAFLRCEAGNTYTKLLTEHFQLIQSPLLCLDQCLLVFLLIFRPVCRLDNIWMEIIKG